MNKWLPASLLLLSACVHPHEQANPPLTCAAISAAPTHLYTLYFGRSVKGRADVTDAEWLDFRDRSITPNLPDGYTVLDATGAWMNPQSRVTITETTKVLVTSLPPTQDAFAAIQRVRQAYRDRFNQLLIGMTRQPGCADF